MGTFKDILRGANPTLAEIAAHLQKLSHGDRIAQTLELDKSDQVRLWELAAAGSALSLDYLLPKGAKVLEPFPFEGRNSLPLYRFFQKVFYRQSNGVIAGYNNSPAAWIAGPGYYVAEMSGRNPKEIAVNYLKLPGEHPAGWPDIRDNMAGLGRFIYGGTVDYLRRVSDDVVIGRAYKGGDQEMPNWFVLCRKIPLK